MQFSAPSTSSNGTTVADLDGHLLVLEPIEYAAEIVTSLGTRDAVRATVHDITTSTTHHDMLIFPKVLVGGLKARIGDRVLATMGKGVAKPGQNAPWVLTDMSADPGAIADATRYLNGATAATLAPAPAAVNQTAGGIELTPEILAALGNLTGK